jgi:hypothetical protein
MYRTAQVASGVAARLRDARIRAGFKSAAAAARANEWPEGAYRHHENGTRGFDIKQAFTYAQAFDTNPRYLLGLDPAFDGFGVHEFLNNVVEPTRESAARSAFIDAARRLYRMEFLREIPFVAEHGIGGDADFSSVRYHAFNIDLLASIDPTLIGGNAATVVMQDASMGATAPIGSLLLVDTRLHRSRTLDGIGVFYIEDRLLVRRVRSDTDEGLLLSADSPDVPDRLVPPGEAGAYGQVRWIGRAI